MIEASVGAVPGLVPAFVIVAVLLAAPTGLVAKVRGRPVTLPMLLATALAGVLTVTLTPGFSGNGKPGTCDEGLPGIAFLASESARLNVLLFIPASFLAVLVFGRPLLVLAGTVVLTTGIELVQGRLDLGRACSYDDVKANVLGGVLGLLLGCLASWVRRRRSPFTRQDTLWGAGALVASTCAVTVACHFTLTTVDYEASHHRASAALGDTGEMREWLLDTVSELYGGATRAEAGTQVSRPQPGRWILRAVLPGRTVVATWPDRRLVGIRTEGGRDDAGTLSETEMRKSAERFARTWFPEETSHADARFQHVENGRGARLLSYRRREGGAVTPMRLDIVVSTAGRIEGLTTRHLPAPAHADAVTGHQAGPGSAPSL
ncbi:VanZ family protein [Streptomyces sp. NPDC059788]|uniref:VanZ family protein n=1 Tax=Streptomyces sp. NPDC059788 TaxID=3346948 RepID=UPI00364B4562